MSVRNTTRSDCAEQAGRTVGMPSQVSSVKRAVVLQMSLLCAVGLSIAVSAPAAQAKLNGATESPSSVQPAATPSSEAVADVQEDAVQAATPDLVQPSLSQLLAQDAEDVTEESQPEAIEEDIPTLGPSEAPPVAPDGRPAPVDTPPNVPPVPTGDLLSVPEEGRLPVPGEPRFDPQLAVPGQPTAPSLITPPTPSFEAYHLGPGDSIFVSVPRYPELSFQTTLDLQGTVIAPLQGAVSLEGLSIEAAAEELRGTFNNFVELEEAGSVSITLIAQRGVEVTVVGAVQRPGFYPLPDPTVATALLTAGGATRTSDLRSIRVQRQFRTAAGTLEERAVDVDLFTPLAEGGALPNVRLEDGDVLVVPELDPSDLDEYDSYLVARSTLAQPIINVRFLNYAGGRGGVGTLNLNNGSSFLDAISLLGVNPDNADLGDVALIRYDPETGRAVTISVDAKEAILGDITQNPPLQDSDVIVVGRNLIGRLSFAIQTVTRPFRDVFGFTRFIDDVFDDNLF